MIANPEEEEGNGLLATSAFSEANVRKGFMRKVYSILSLQLMVTAAVMGIFFVPEVKLYAAQNTWMVWVAFVPILICIIVLSCCGDFRYFFK